MTHPVTSSKKTGWDAVEAAQETADYLYAIKGKVTPKQATAIGFLRQLINEEFVPHKRQVSSQMIYDILKEVL